MTAFMAVAGSSHAESLTRVANTSLNLPATTPDEGGYTFVNAFGSLTFSSPIALATAPGDLGYVYVVERGGRAQRVDLSTNTKSEFFDLNDIFASVSGTYLTSSSESGFLSMAFHPDYANNGRIFVFYSLVIDGQLHQRIAELKATAPTGNPVNYLNATTVNVQTTHKPLITQRDQAGNHNGGDIHFGNDGYLYISVGDEGGANDNYNNGRFIDKDFFSAILRIDVDKKAGNLTPNVHSQSNSTSHPTAVHANTYLIPNDNPFIGATSHHGLTIDADDVRTEIWATGLRNPFRFCFDSPTGRCFVADVGQDVVEEVSIVSSGDDCGWSYRDGNIAWPYGPGGSNTPTGWNPLEPIHAYSHGSSSTQGNSVTGGRVYRGARLSELAGTYIFSDYISGNVWSLKEAANGTWSSTRLTGRSALSGFGIDPSNGDLLACHLSGHRVRRLVRAGSSNPAPALLSQTGAFSDLTNLTPAAGIYAYDVNLPFWSDHAVKRRWFSIPNVSDKMTFSADGFWNFPAGQVWIKHFDIEMQRGVPASTRRLETRFLVKTSTGAYGLSYRWREDGTDADLVSSAGFEEPLSIEVSGSATNQVWSYPSRSQCFSCHQPENNYALSFHTRQMNRDGELGNDQIDQLHCAGFLNSTPEESRSLRAHPSLNDTTVSREARVRAYLDVNCAMCHRSDTSSTPALFDARAPTPTDLTGLINGSLADDLGDSSNRVVVPGDSGHSVLLSRLNGTASRMPPLASNVLDQEAITLINDWINVGLLTRQSYSQWAAVELQGAPNNQPGDDADGDGQSNRHEYLAGTDPLDPNSAFRLSFTGGPVHSVSFTHPANRSAIIEASSNLSDWFILPDTDNSLLPPATSGVRTLDVPAEQPKLFFRAIFSQP